MEEKPSRAWESGLFDCFEEASTCCYGFWCCPCLACTVSRRFGENTCLPLCDMLSPSICAALGIPLFAPAAAVGLRGSMRNRYGIKGSVCNDIAASCFCLMCSWCQMHRELKHRKQVPTVINVQTPTVVQMQPPMMMVPGNVTTTGTVTHSNIVMHSF